VHSEWSPRWMQRKNSIASELPEASCADSGKALAGRCPETLEGRLWQRRREVAGRRARRWRAPFAGRRCHGGWDACGHRELETRGAGKSAVRSPAAPGGINRCEKPRTNWELLDHRLAGPIEFAPGAACKLSRPALVHPLKHARVPVGRNAANQDSRQDLNNANWKRRSDGALEGTGDCVWARQTERIADLYRQVRAGSATCTTC
jgi:hypothetical protein